jgi:hypothetical protein
MPEYEYQRKWIPISLRLQHNQHNQVQGQGHRKLQRLCGPVRRKMMITINWEGKNPKEMEEGQQSPN